MSCIGLSAGRLRLSAPTVKVKVKVPLIFQYILQNVHLFIFQITLSKINQFFMIFGLLNPEKNWHQQLVHLPISPVYCSHFTLGNPTKVIFNSIIHTYFRLFTVISEENKLLPPCPPHLKNVTTLLCKMHNFLIWLKVCCIPPYVGGSEKAGCGWEEPVVICGKWNIRQAMLQQMYKVTTFCMDTCFQSISPLINCIVHYALLKFSPSRNKTLPQLIYIADWWYLIRLKDWKRWKMCAFNKVVW